MGAARADRGPDRVVLLAVDRGNPDRARAAAGPVPVALAAPRAVVAVVGAPVVSVVIRSRAARRSRELLLAGKRRVDEVLMIDDLAGAEVLVDIEELSQELGVGLRRVSRRHLGAEALTESHQGVIARAAPLDEADFDRLADDDRAFLLVLDGITDPGNLGAILRTAECAGVSGVVLGRHRSVHVTPTVTKSAAGAVEHVPMALVAGIPSAVAELERRGVVTVGLDGGGSRSIFDLGQAPTGPIALVMGAEGSGLSRLVRERVEVLASIPLAGELNSLNVATATAVACFE